MQDGSRQIDGTPLPCDWSPGVKTCALSTLIRVKDILKLSNIPL
jgi:hypothetical protein